MTAEYVQVASALPLLYEPDALVGRGPRLCGWRIEGGERVRRYDHDALGALAQHVIVRYAVHGISRAQLAAETHYSERQIQAWICGSALPAYGGPVIRALGALGIGTTKGNRLPAGAGRLLEILAAQIALLERSDEMLSYLHAWLPATELRQTIRLLLAGRQPLDGGGRHDAG